MQVTGRSYTSSITEKNLLQFLLVFFLLFPLWLFWFFAFSFMTHLNGHLKLFMLLLELLCLCQAARDGEAGHQHGLRVLDPSHHLEMKYERPAKRKISAFSPVWHQPGKLQAERIAPAWFAGLWQGPPCQQHAPGDHQLWKIKFVSFFKIIFAKTALAIF